MPIEAVIFDMDGVLVDSEPMHFATTNEVLGRRGAAISPDEYESCLGMTEIAFFERLVRQRGLTEPAADLARERLEASLELMSWGPLLPMDGALECLIWLAADGYRLGLASSATRAQVTLVVDRLGLGRVLHAAVSTDDVLRGKPAPDLFLEAARRLDVAPADCLVVEDAVLGVTAAIAAGMAAVAVVPREGTGQAHLAAGARTCVTSLHQLTAELLDRLAVGRS